MARVHQVEVRPDGDRFLDEVSVGELIQLESGESSITAMAQIVSKFVWKDGTYLASDAAFPIVSQLSIRQLREAVDSLKEAGENSAITPTSAPGLE